jgi:hypothetical protein
VTNKKKWEEEKRKNSGSGSNGCGSGGKCYERSKFGGDGVVKNHQEVVLKSLTTFGICTVTRVVGGTVPIPLVFIPPSLQILLPFLLPCP